MKCKCDKCSMEVKGLVCGKCESALVNEKMTKNGKEVRVAKCPNGCGMIKFPTCCGQDMICSE